VDGVVAADGEEVVGVVRGGGTEDMDGGCVGVSEVHGQAAAVLHASPAQGPQSVRLPRPLPRLLRPLRLRRPASPAHRLPPPVRPPPRPSPPPRPQLRCPPSLTPPWSPSSSSSAGPVQASSSRPFSSMLSHTPSRQGHSMRETRPEVQFLPSLRHVPLSFSCPPAPDLPTSRRPSPRRASP
jgi:hypothetical protein